MSNGSDPRWPALARRQRYALAIVAENAVQFSKRQIARQPLVNSLV